MSNQNSSDAVSMSAELSALADTLEQCCQRIGSLAASRVIAVRQQSDPNIGDDVLAAIYEAERGLNYAHRLLVRAARLGR